MAQPPSRPLGTFSRAAFPSTYAYQTARAQLLGFDSYAHERRFRAALRSDPRARQFNAIFRRATGGKLATTPITKLSRAELITLRQYNRNAYQAWRQHYPPSNVGALANLLRLTGVRPVTDYREAAGYAETEGWQHFENWLESKHDFDARPQEYRDIQEYAWVLDRNETAAKLREYQ